jgi:hypothetical protein
LYIQIVDSFSQIPILDELDHLGFVEGKTATSLAHRHLVECEEVDLAEHIREERVHSVVHREILLEQE